MQAAHGSASENHCVFCALRIRRASADQTSSPIAPHALADTACRSGLFTSRFSLHVILYNLSCDLYLPPPFLPLPQSVSSSSPSISPTALSPSPTPLL